METEDKKEDQEPGWGCGEAIGAILLIPMMVLGAVMSYYLWCGIAWVIAKFLDLIASYRG